MSLDPALDLSVREREPTTRAGHEFASMRTRCSVRRANLEGVAGYGVALTPAETAPYYIA